MEIYLKNDAVEATICTHGGELISLKDAEGQEYLWNGDSRYWSGINPILFPIVGALKDGKVCLDGKTLEMNRHGFARDQEFRVVTSNTDSVLLELTDTQKTWQQYPRHFRLQVLHQLNADGFTTSFEVINTGDRELPFCIGAHTAFRCPLREGENFEEYEIVFDKKECAKNLLLNEEGLICGYSEVDFLNVSDRFPLSYQTFEELDTIILKDLVSTGIQIQHRESGHGIRVEYEGFPIIAFWTPGEKRAPFLCIEPWHGCGAEKEESGKFQDKESCILLASGESISLKYVVKMLLKS